MKERIKLLRKTLELNQTDFGKRIGVKQGSVAGYETGKRIPLDTVIDNICKEFHVNKVWLKTGIGDMFISGDDLDEIGKHIFKYSNNPDEPIYKSINLFMNVYEKLDNKSKEILNKLLDDLISEIKKEQN